MSAETLRAGAKVARDEWAGETTGPFKYSARIHLAVADLLEQAAVHFEGGSLTVHPMTKRALVVARAYLGEATS